MPTARCGCRPARPTTRRRPSPVCSSSRSTVPFSAALPKAVTYSDTGITLNEHSNVYAVTSDGQPWPSTSPSPATYISAGGTWTSSRPDEVGRFTITSSAYQTLSAPTGTAQSLGIKANGSVKSQLDHVHHQQPRRPDRAVSRSRDVQVHQDRARHGRVPERLLRPGCPGGPHRRVAGGRHAGHGADGAGLVGADRIHLHQLHPALDHHGRELHQHLAEPLPAPAAT